MAGWLTVEEAEAQIDAASTKYKDAETDGDLILQDRFDSLIVSHDFVTDSTDLNSTSAYNANGDYIGEVYSGGNVSWDGTWPSTDTLIGQILDEFDEGATPDIYDTGGPIPGAGQGFPDQTGWTAYCDSLVLAEASKITGEKWF